MIELISFLGVYSVGITVAYIIEVKDCARKDKAFDEMNNLWHDECINFINEIGKLNKELIKYKRKRDPVTGRFVKVTK